MSSRFKVVLSSMSGNMLEFYDFYLYGTFASILAGLFFPSYDATAALIASLGTFAAGYLMRPIGAVVFGHLGDRLGRKKALTLSIFFMAIPTLVIGLLPTYHTIGIFAPIILFSCRLLQGVCAGGEYNGAAIFTIEHMKKNHDGFAGSLMSVSGGGGGLLATFLGALFMHPSMPSWSWRVPFIFGAFLGVVGYYIRKKIGESPAFKEEVSKKPLSVPLLKAFQQYPVSILCCVGGAAFSGALSSTFVVYMNIYLTKVVGLTLNHSLWFNSFGLLIFVASAPLAGFLSDRFGKPRIMTISAIALILLFYPIFSLASLGTAKAILLAQFLLSFFAAGFIAPMNAFMNKLFPANTRYSGIAFGYGVGMATLGGTLAIAAALLIEITGNTMAPAFYLMGLGCLGLLITQVGKRIAYGNGSVTQSFEGTALPKTKEVAL